MFSTFFTVFMCFNFNFSSGSNEHISAFEQISRMLFDILPPNIIDPFKTGNTFQIIVIAIFISCGLLVSKSGEKIFVALLLKLLRSSSIYFHLYVQLFRCIFSACCSK